MAKSAGFEKEEAQQFEIAAEPWQPDLLAKEIRVTNADEFAQPPASLAEKLEWRPEEGKLILKVRLNEEEIRQARQVIKNQDIMDEITHYSGGLYSPVQRVPRATPSQRGERALVPRLTLDIELAGQKIREIFLIRRLKSSRIRQSPRATPRRRKKNSPVSRSTTRWPRRSMSMKTGV